jgi:hypothetical protein
LVQIEILSHEYSENILKNFSTMSVNKTARKSIRAFHKKSEVGYILGGILPHTEDIETFGFFRLKRL